MCSSDLPRRRQRFSALERGLGGVTRIGVLGAGAWGTALAAVLAGRHEVTLWARDAAQAEAIGRARENARYLPGVPLPAALAVTDRWPVRPHLLLVATPVAGLRAVLPRAAGVPLVWLCKGFEAVYAQRQQQGADAAPRIEAAT